MGLKIIVTGSTGMVGEGVLLVCLNNPDIEEILCVSRRANGISHPKIKEYIVPDFLKLALDDENLKGYNACFFCAGVSSIGKNEAEFSKLTYDTTIHFAKVVLHQNPISDFIYVSGRSTDSTENGTVMWARVKGKTENELAHMGFKEEYNFRPGFMKPMPGQRYTLKGYKLLGWLYPVLKSIFPGITSTMKEVGDAMIYCALHGYKIRNLEVNDIKNAAALLQK